MRKTVGVILSLMLLCSTNFTHAGESNNNTHTHINSNNTANCDKNTTINPSSDFDEFDDLIDDAVQNNAISTDIQLEKPSKYKILIAKFGIIFFLKPYIYVVTKYRAVKNAIVKYLTAAWSLIAGNQSEQKDPEYERK